MCHKFKKVVEVIGCIYFVSNKNLVKSWEMICNCNGLEARPVHKIPIRLKNGITEKVICERWLRWIRWQRYRRIFTSLLFNISTEWFVTRWMGRQRPNVGVQMLQKRGEWDINGSYGGRAAKCALIQMKSRPSHNMSKHRKKCAKELPPTCSSVVEM